MISKSLSSLAYLIDFEKLSSINLDKIEIQHSEYIWYDLKNNDNQKLKYINILNHI